MQQSLKSYILYFLCLLSFTTKYPAEAGKSPKGNQGQAGHQSKNQRIVKNDEGYAMGSFEGGKTDIYNRYIEDIRYEIIPTANHVIAIGEKLSSNDHDSQEKEPETIDGILEQIMLESEVDNGAQKNKEAEKNDLVVKKIRSKSMILIPFYFDNLSNWKKDNHDHALESFLNSCKVIVSYVKKGRQIKNSELQFGDINDWYETCLEGVKYGRLEKSRKFFEENFIPFLVYDRTKASSAGRFTGYNEFSVKGSMRKSKKYNYPIYFRPKTCKSSQTCPTRAQIYNGILDGLGLEICWIDNPMDLFRMQIQGSGIVVLNNHKFLRISFSGTNQRKTQDIWKHFDASKFLPPGQRSKNDVNRWLYNNPRTAEKLLGHNPSYTFFTLNNRKYAIGSSGSGLTPSRSVAIDPRYIPYGMPMWIETKLPVRDARDPDNKRWINLHRLTVAQDTGTAIKGVVRADIFFGHGDKASYLAHHTHFDGSYYMLIPKRVVNKIKALQ